MPFGISTHLYHDVRLDSGSPGQIAAHGFEAVEVFATRSHIDYHDEAAVSALAGHLRDTGLRVHSVHAPIAESLRGGVWGPPFSIARTTEAARRAGVNEIGAAARAAAHLGARHLVVHVGVPDAQSPAADDNRPAAALRSLEEIQAVASPLGLSLALEVIPNALSTPDRLVQWLEDELELPGAGICLDSGHAHLMGDVVDAVETVSGHLLTTHLHDNGGAGDEHLVPFEGGIDWPAVLTSFQKVGYDGTWMFELAATDSPRQVLERASGARKRFERILESS